MAKIFRVKVREISEVWHEVTVDDTFKPHIFLDDWIEEIATQNSIPVEVEDVQVSEVLEAVEVVTN